MNFKCFSVTLIGLFLFSGTFCENSTHILGSKEGIVFLNTYRTPLVGGAGNKGMKISLVIQIDTDIQLDSIVYNKRAGEVTEVKKEGNVIWVESYFYAHKKMIKGRGVQEYKAEGDSCELFYSRDKESKSLKILSLELKQDNTLWE
jgi:hypothetical protein